VVVPLERDQVRWWSRVTQPIQVCCSDSDFILVPDMFINILLVRISSEVVLEPECDQAVESGGEGFIRCWVLPVNRLG